MTGIYVVLIFLCLCIFLSSLVNIAQVYEVLEKGGTKSVSLPFVLRSPKKHCMNTIKFCCCHSGSLRLKNFFSEFYVFHKNLYAQDA